MSSDEIISDLKTRLDATDEPAGADAAAEVMVYEVTEAIVQLVKTVCMGDRALYRDLLETVAQRLGGV